MRRRWLILLIIGLATTLSRAETPWCNAISVADDVKPAYPPIARAARISGIVLMRVTVDQQSDITDVSPIFGPKMLEIASTGQMKKWHLQRDFNEAGPCLGTVIIDFQFLAEDRVISESEPVSASIIRNLIRFSVKTETVTISDPPVYLGKRHFFPWFKKHNHAE
jgi:hypothetical protein